MLSINITRMQISYFFFLVFFSVISDGVDIILIEVGKSSVKGLKFGFSNLKISYILLNYCQTLGFE